MNELSEFINNIVFILASAIVTTKHRTSNGHNAKTV